MEFEWDEDKRAANFTKHGLDLLRGTVLFDGRPRYTYSSPRAGEQRFVSVALVGNEFVALVWTERGAVTRLISLRRARNGEKGAYRAIFG
jgi:uncharacterized DUF497 family protein